MTMPPQTSSDQPHRPEQKAIAPDWAWSLRAAIYPGKNIDGGQLELLNPDPQTIEANVARFVTRGVNFLQTPGFHARFMWIDQHEAILNFSQLVAEAAHRRGIRCYAHMTVNGIWSCMEQTYRGWAPDSASNVDIRTGLRLPPDKPRFMCINHPQFIEHHTHYVLDFIKRTNVDGLMYDDMHFRHGQYGCGCEHCRVLFEQWMQMPMPQPGHWPLDDYEHPTWRAWIRFRLLACQHRIQSMRALLPRDFLLFSCMSAAMLSLDDAHHGGGGFENFAQETNLLVYEVLPAFRHAHQWDRNNFDNWEKLYLEKKYVDAVAQHYTHPTLEAHYSGNEDDGFFVWAHTRLLGHQLWRNDANFYGGPRYADEFERCTPEYDYLKWDAEHEELFRFSQPCAKIGVLFSFQSKRSLAADPQPHAEESMGWMQTLRDAGLHFDVIIDADLDALENLSRFEMLILPNAVCLSDRQCDTLRKFVARGGNVVASSQTSLRDELGQSRNDFAIADLLGVHFSEHPPTQRSSLLLDARLQKGFAQTLLPLRLPIFQNGLVQWEGETPERTALAWLEKTRRSFEWPRVPGVVLNRFANGTVIYVLPCLGQSAYREGLFPLWHQQEHQEIESKSLTDQSTWWTYHSPRDENNKQWMFVDRRDIGAVTWIVALMRHLKPQQEVQVEVLHKHVLWDVRRLSSSPTDRSDKGDRVVSLLNVSGSVHAEGDFVAHPPVVKFPTLPDDVRITWTCRDVTSVQLHSPDLPKALDLHIEINSVTVPKSVCQRVAWVRLHRLDSSVTL